MKKDASFGIIPLKFQQHEWFVLIVQHLAGHWSFPKGHPEAEESPRQSAERELHEETGLVVEEWLSEATLSEHYAFKVNGELVSKVVTYFLAKVAGEVAILKEELRDAKWVPLKEAADHVTFKEAVNICNKVVNILKL